MFGLTAIAMQPPETRQRWWDSIRRAAGVKVAAGAGLVAGVLMWVGAWSLPDGRLHITFFDVGDGSATLIETPGGRQILVDAGGSGRALSAGLGDALPFWDRRIDLLIITQPTQSHLSGLPAILGRYQFDAVLDNGSAGASQSARAVHTAFEAAGIPQIAVQAGQRIAVGDGVALTVIGQPGAGATEEDPGAPVSLLVEYGSVQFLLPGDLSTEEEANLLRDGGLQAVALLLVPRSGHREAASAAFLEATQPDVAILIVEEGNRYGLPHTETLDRLAAAGATLYRSDQQGEIRVITDGAQVWVRTSKQDTAP
jgi:competence protein ComEC